MDAAIVTDTEGLTTGDARVPTADGKIPAYWAKPSREGLLPVVLVVQEIFGVNDYIRDVCRRLAKQGYLAIAPELYARQGDTSKLTDIQEIISRVVSKVPDEQVMSDLDATAAWVVEHGLADPERLA